MAVHVGGQAGGHCLYEVWWIEVDNSILGMEVNIMGGNGRGGFVEIRADESDRVMEWEYSW